MIVAEPRTISADSQVATRLSGGPALRWLQKGKLALLPSYYAATWPLRWAYSRWLKGQGRVPMLVLALHRVADDTATSWTTHTDAFRRKVAWLQKRFDLVSLEEVQRRIRCPNNYRPTVSITFDDGYSENCRVALPLLLNHHIPFTYFVTTNPVLQSGYFEHDLRLGLKLPPNTVEQLRELAAAGVEIGAHTRTHADLGAIDDPQRLHDEVVVARDELQAALNCRIRYFAFPFGRPENLNREAFRIAADAGYEAVVSAYGGYNFPGDDTFHLQRPCVDGSTTRVKHWALPDPCRQRNIHRFDYREPSTPL
ncbi:MAG: polysaccharide deacetylase family protein [Planctomycetes bacterium]|nr:polysaccharide deacetylase family protein [Planctomycetota bacterium]